MRRQAILVIALCTGTGAPVARAQSSEIQQQIALFSKGRPVTMSRDDWDVDRIGFFSRLKDLVELERSLAAARPAVPLLVASLNDPTPEVAVSAAGTLLVIDPASRGLAMTGLAAGLRSGSDQAEQWALQDLAGQARPGDLPRDVENLLTVYLSDARNMHRYKAVRTLRHVPTSRVGAVIALLVPALADRDRAVRVSAADTLGFFGPRAQAATVALRQMLSSRAGDERVVAATALARISVTPDPSLIPIFVDQFTSTSMLDRKEAVRGLALLGPAAASAAPALRKLREGADESLRRDIDVALARIGAGGGVQPVARAIRLQSAGVSVQPAHRPRRNSAARRRQS